MLREEGEMQDTRPPSPIHLVDLTPWAGFAADDSPAGATKARVVYQGAFTSDDSRFYHAMDGISSAILSRAGVIPSVVYQFLVVWHSDKSLDLYVNDFGVTGEVRVKRPIAKGQLLEAKNIVDVQSIRIVGVNLKDDDSLIYCFKVGWRFALYFDLRRATDPTARLDAQELERILARLFRYLAFIDVYKTVESGAAFQEMLDDGWFPFVELLGGEFESLSRTYTRKLGVEAGAARTVAAFDDTRLAKITDRWWSNRLFNDKKEILLAGVGGFKSRTEAGYIQCIKTLLPEIEGILRLQYIKDTGSGRMSTKDFIDHLSDIAIAKARSETSLLLPKEFTDYLRNVVFASFDLSSGKVDMSRHSSAHGVASAEQYTAARALQAILTLDQILFYL
jgi:hypothetical protein